MFIASRGRTNPFSPTCVRFFQDESFRWAQENKDDARAILIPPSSSAVHSSSTIHSLSTLETYLEQRNWVLRGKHHGVALLSHVLSAPLTLCYSAQQTKLSTTTTTTTTTRDTKWCCLGARAEATLPLHFWKECLVASPNQQTWSIDFVGPDLQGNNATSPIVLMENGSQLTMSRYFQGYFHDLPSETIPAWDAYILFNPGLGHAHLKDSWAPTLELVRGKSLCLTAHSACDAERDAKVVKDTLGVDVDYTENPFASRIVYQDPMDKTHFVSPNKYIAWISKDASS